MDNNGSGSNSPTKATTTDERETAVTSVSNNDVESVASYQPNIRAPNPTPAGTVVMGGFAADPVTLDECLVHIDMVPSTAPSLVGTKDALSRIFEEEEGVPTASASSSVGDTAMSDPFPEHSMWDAPVMEELEYMLKRLAMVACDEHTQNPAKSVQEYYSERLALLIKGGEIAFDGKYLQ